MANLKCACGNVLSNSRCPSPNNGWLLRDVDVDNVESDITEIARDVWECHECGRVAIGNHGDAHVKWYSPDDGMAGGLTKF